MSPKNPQHLLSVHLTFGFLEHPLAEVFEKIDQANKVFFLNFLLPDSYSST